MTDYLELGANWLKEMVAAHATQTVSIKTDSTTHEDIPASLVDEEGRLLPGPVELKTDHTRFMFATDDLEGITLKRNTYIIFGSATYKMVQRGSRLWHYNDAFHKHIVVDTKYVSDEPS